MRYLKILFLSMLVVGLIANAAFAGKIYFGDKAGPNVMYSVALEAMGNARNLQILSASGTATTVAPGVWILPSQALVSGSLLTVSFTNAALEGSLPIYICQMDANYSVNSSGYGGGGAPLAPIGSATPTANNTTTSFVLSGNTVAGNLVFLTTNATSTNCASNGNILLRFQPVSSASMATISYNVAISGTVYDSGTAANNLANITRQYTTYYNSTTSSIDYLNAPANGSKFATNSNYTAYYTNAVNIVNAGQLAGSPGPAITFNVNTITSSLGLTVGALISLQDSASWAGVTSVYARDGASATNCSPTGGSNKAANNSPSGTVNLSLLAATFDGGSTSAAAGTGIVMCAQVAGNSVLSTRTIKAATDINVTGTGANDPAMDPYTTIMQWQSNGYQGIVPYLSASSTYTTICFLNNKSAAGGAATADILTSESGATLTSLSGLSLGTLAAGQTMRVDFASSITPYTYSGGTESAGTAIPLTTLQANDRYSVQINVGASPTQIIVNCIQVDPAGSKRAVPVLTQQDTAKAWTQ